MNSDRIFREVITLWWRTDDKDIVGKSIKDIEQSYSNQEELINAKKRSKILWVSLGVLLAVFFLVTVLGNRLSSETTAEHPGNTTPDQTTMTGDPLEVTRSAQNENDSDTTEEVTLPGIEENEITDGTDTTVADSSIRSSGLETVSHQIRHGENFASISILYFDTDQYADSLAAFNNMTQEDMLYVGYYLQIPVDPLLF